METKFETIQGRGEMYDLLSEKADEETFTLLKDAIKYEEKESVRAYIIILCAEMMKTLGYNDEVAFSFINGLENSEDVKDSTYCMGSCYLAKHMFGDTTAKDKVEEIMKVAM